MTESDAALRDALIDMALMRRTVTRQEAQRLRNEPLTFVQDFVSERDKPETARDPEWPKVPR